MLTSNNKADFDIAKTYLRDIHVNNCATNDFAKIDGNLPKEKSISDQSLPNMKIGKSMER